MISDRQRRNLAKYSDTELMFRIENISKQYSILQEERHLREKGDRPYSLDGRRVKK